MTERVTEIQKAELLDAIPRDMPQHQVLRRLLIECDRDRRALEGIRAWLTNATGMRVFTSYSGGTPNRDSETDFSRGVSSAATQAIAELDRLTATPQHCLDCGREVVLIGGVWFVVDGWVRMSPALLSDDEASEPEELKQGQFCGGTRRRGRDKQMMSERVFGGFLAFSLVVGVVAITAVGSEPAAVPQWQHQACSTLDDVDKLLNRLPLDRALEAKIVVINSQRSFLGALSDPYYVYFRQ